MNGFVFSTLFSFFSSSFFFVVVPVSIATCSRILVIFKSLSSLVPYFNILNIVIVITAYRHLRSPIFGHCGIHIIYDSTLFFCLSLLFYYSYFFVRFILSLSFSLSPSSFILHKIHKKTLKKSVLII